VNLAKSLFLAGLRGVPGFCQGLAQKQLSRTLESVESVVSLAASVRIAQALR
jgi:hypothetical protein